MQKHFQKLKRMSPRAIYLKIENMFRRLCLKNKYTQIKKYHHSVLLALSKPLIILHDDEHRNALKEIDA